MAESGHEYCDYMDDLSHFVHPHELQAMSQASNEEALQMINMKNEMKGKVSWKERKKLKENRKKQAEEQHLVEGLNSAIPSSNIGFKMLQKMGYKPGDAIGRHGNGTLEPVQVELKHSRSGLGIDSMEKARKKNLARQMAVERHAKKAKRQELEYSFQEKTRSSWKNKQLVIQYSKAANTLLQLKDPFGKDSEKDLNKNKEGDASDDSTNEEEEPVTQEMLVELLTELRNKFYYCLYCGCQYESAEALSNSCPGLEEDVH